ncbi:MAG: trimethylamine methyltransferase family protein [Proteobacteria bacterium]|nr:trimethylamine methyltransferase family protein [Pseudomonadota bacterium]MDA1071615.1 trimethylamine methyltransferase family protein [Pseudomonadota bacterium]
MARREGRQAAGKRKGAAGEVRKVPQLPWCTVRNPYPPFEIASADQIEATHEASLDALQEIGINFLLAEARDILKAAGADVDPASTRVRFERSFIEEAVARAPSHFTLHARNPQRHRIFGGNHINFLPVAGNPNISDIEGGRRSGNLKDYRDLLRLAQVINAVHGCTPMLEPIDVEPNIRYLDIVGEQLLITDKIAFGYSLGRRKITDAIEMVRIARGIDEATLLKEPSLWTVVNANSPLQLDIPMLLGMIEMARMNQPIVVTPFTLAGAMAPVSIAGALVQQNAEALAGIAFCQTVNPGCPVVYGGFTSNVDMKSGSPAFGTPEYVQAVLIGGQLARRYRLPYRSSNVNAANWPDAQATYESANSLWATCLGHTNMLMHSFGWMEGGLRASFEKIVIDLEMVQTMMKVMEPVSFEQAELGLDAMREVGPGGHYFGAAHTLERYENAFYEPLLSDWRNWETWQQDGAVDATHRAHKVWKQLLAEYEEPAMEPAIREELTGFIARRKSEGGATADD